MPERMELRLSDAFFTEGGKKSHKQPAVEVVADILYKNKMEVIEVFLTEYDEEKQRIIEEKETGRAE